MKSKKSLDKLLNSTRQYHARALLEPNEFMSLFNDTLSELRITKKIDTDRLESEICNYLNILDWFGHVSTKITQNFFDKGLDIAVIDKDGSKAQHKTHSDEFVNYIITEYIEERHKKKFGSSMAELHSHQGIKRSDIQGNWHTVTQDNGITLTVETVVSSLIEYERSYLSQLASRGTLQALQNIQKIFNSVRYSNSTEAIIIQILEQCTELYLMQYEISSTLLPFHLGDEGISSNIDRIYEVYSAGKDQMVRKIMGMISVTAQPSISKDSERITKELKRLADDVITESMVDEWEHPEVTVQEPKKENTAERKRSGVEVVEPIKEVDVPNTKTVEPPKKTEALDAVKSEPQTVKITKEPVLDSAEDVETLSVNVSHKPIVEQEPIIQVGSISFAQLLDRYCEKKISDDEYKVAGEFYLMKEHNQFSLMLLSGHKTVGKDEDAYEEPLYKRISKTPYFIVAKTEHMQSGDQGVQLIAINNNSSKHTYITLGDADSKKVKTTLRNKGILIESPKLNADYIDFMYQNIDRQLFISDEVGWLNHASKFGFVLPNKFGIGISGLEYSGKNPNLLHAIETKGDLNTWLSIFNELDLEKAHPRIAFLLFSALLPLFANYHDTFEGFVINITPDYTEGKGSSNGKTTVQQLMLSLQGSTEHWHTNWNKTALAMEEYLYTNVGAYFDDTSKTKMKPQELEDLIYSISDAESRGSSRQGARTRKTVMYSTGEKDFLDHDGKDGVYVRYVDVGIKQNDYGSEDSEITRKIVDHIKKIVVTNYGFIYPEAIRIFLEDKDSILEKTDRYIDTMAQYGKYDNASRIAKRYAMIAVCGEVFIEIMRKLTDDSTLYDSLNPFKISLDMFKVHDSKLIEMEQTQETVSENLLSDLLNKFTEDAQHTLYDKDGRVIGFVEDGNIYYIQSKEVTGNLPEKMTKNAFLSKIDKTLIVDNSKNTTRKHINSGKPMRYDIFRKV